MRTFPTTEESSALVLAAQKGEVDQVSAMLAQGAPIEGIGLGKMTPLFAATLHRQVPVMRLLLEAGANPNSAHIDHTESPEAGHRVALNVAISNSDIDAINLLLDFGANARFTNAKGSPPLTQLIQNTHKVLSQTDGADKLIAAVTRLLDAGARINQSGSQGENALERAMGVRAPFDLFELLVTRGADLDRYDEFGNRPLHKASEAGLVRHVSLLLERGADANAVNTLERTALWDFKGEEVGRALLDAGADINWQDSHGTTALASLLLDWRTKDEVTPEMHFLINEGANLDLPDFEGRTARDIIAQRRFHTIGGFVSAHEARVAMRSATSCLTIDKPAKKPTSARTA